ncbi:hypothetical protein M2132_000191 [Dysgonomonas sp. PH5-45]|nr:hypothetical protein [Dysgonomonas sp. PH5-45]MDH6386777.1 hypothetical protein [Dysgonomonas sp. PH5-37]
MFIIISHILNPSYLRSIPNVYANEDQYIDIDRIRTELPKTRFPFGREPLFSHALSRRIAQIGRFKFRTSWRTDRNDRSKRQRLGKTIESEGIKGLHTRPGQGRKPRYTVCSMNIAHRSHSS